MESTEGPTLEYVLGKLGVPMDNNLKSLTASQFAGSKDSSSALRENLYNKFMSIETFELSEDKIRCLCEFISKTSDFFDNKQKMNLIFKFGPHLYGLNNFGKKIKFEDNFKELIEDFKSGMNTEKLLGYIGRYEKCSEFEFVQNHIIREFELDDYKCLALVVTGRASLFSKVDKDKFDKFAKIIRSMGIRIFRSKKLGINDWYELNSLNMLPENMLPENMLSENRLSKNRLPEVMLSVEQQKELMRMDLRECVNKELENKEIKGEIIPNCCKYLTGYLNYLMSDKDYCNNLNKFKSEGYANFSMLTSLTEKYTKNPEKRYCALTLYLILDHVYSHFFVVLLSKHIDKDKITEVSVDEVEKYFGGFIKSVLKSAGINVVELEVSEKEKLKTENRRLKNMAKDALNDKITINKMKTELEKGQKEFSELKSKFDELQGYCNELSNEIDQLHKSEKQKYDQNKKYECILKSNDELKDKNKNLEKKVEDLAKELNSRNEELVNLKQEIEESRNKECVLNKENIALRSENSSILKINEELMNKNKLLEEKMDELTKQDERYKKIESRNKNLTGWLTKAKKMVKEAEEIRGHNEELKKSILDLREQVESLKKRIEDSKKESSDLYNSNIELIREKDKVFLKTKELTNENNELKKKIGDLEKMQSYIGNFPQTETKIINMINNLKELQKDLRGYTKYGSSNYVPKESFQNKNINNITFKNFSDSHSNINNTDNMVNHNNICNRNTNNLDYSRFVSYYSNINSINFNNLGSYREYGFDNKKYK